jgi:hypothetical protein
MVGATGFIDGNAVGALFCSLASMCDARAPGVGNSSRSIRNGTSTLKLFASTTLTCVRSIESKPKSKNETDASISEAGIPDTVARSACKRAMTLAEVAGVGAAVFVGRFAAS